MKTPTKDASFWLFFLSFFKKTKPNQTKPNQTKPKKQKTKNKKQKKEKSKSLSDYTNLFFHFRFGFRFDF